MNQNLIIVEFPGFAGGRFLTNCLTLSQQALPYHAGLAQVDLLLQNSSMTPEQACLQVAKKAYDKISGPDWPSLLDLYHNNYTVTDELKQFEYRLQNIGKILQVLPAKTYKEFKLLAVLSSMPPADDLISWQDREFTTLDFWGFQPYELMSTSYNLLSHDPVVDQAVAANKKIFFLSHDAELCNKMSAAWPGCYRISLVNSEKFRNLARPLKLSERLAAYESQRTEPVPSLFHAEYNFDVDQNYFDLDHFLAGMRDLYRYCDLDDFDTDQLTKFYTHYMNLHRVH